MGVLKSVLAMILFTWFVIATVGALGMPPAEYKMFAWAIVACGQIVFVVGLWEVCAKVFGRRTVK